MKSKWKRPDRVQAEAGREGGSIGKEATLKDTGFRAFVVVAIRPNGDRAVAGRFPSRQGAEHGAALMRKIARHFGGGDVVIEERPLQLNLNFGK